MGVYIADNKLVISTETKTFVLIYLKILTIAFSHEIYSILKYNKLLTEHPIKNEFRQLLSKYKHGSVIHEHGKQ